MEAFRTLHDVGSTVVAFRRIRRWGVRGRPRHRRGGPFMKCDVCNAEIRYYCIEAGDTLTEIAKRFYGDSLKFVEIFEANRDIIKTPNLIYPGQKIRIP